MTAVAFGLLVAAAGCAPSATVATNKDPNFTRQPQKLAVIEALGPELGSYTDSFKITLSQQIKSCGIDARYMYGPAATITDKEKQTENAFIQLFGPDAILGIEEAGYNRRVLSNNAGVLRNDVSLINYNLQLFDTATKKYVWKAQVSLDTHFGLIEVGDAGAELANTVMQKLEQDDIFRSCPASESK